MLQNLRKGGSRKAQSQKGGGLTLPAARLVQGGRAKRPGVRARTAGLSLRVTASESIGRPDRRPENVADVSESLASLESLFDPSKQSARAVDFVAVERPRRESGSLPTAEGFRAVHMTPAQGSGERLVRSGAKFPAHSVNAPLEGASATGTAVLTEGTQESLSGANEAEGLVAGLRSSRGGAQPSTTGRKEPWRTLSGGEGALQRVVQRLLEDDTLLGGAETPDGQHGEQSGEPLETFRRGAVEAMGRGDYAEHGRAQARGAGKTEGQGSQETQLGAEHPTQMSLNGTARSAGSSPERKGRGVAGRAMTGVEPQIENATSDSSWGSAASHVVRNGKSVWRRDGSETVPQTESPASSSSQGVVASNGARKGRSVWRRDAGDAGTEALSEANTARSSSHSLLDTEKTGPFETEPVDESAVSIVVSAVTSLLDAEDGISFRMLERHLEPWVGRVSQPGWEQVMETFESDGDWGAVLAVLGWMVGRHAGTEPEIERALLNSGSPWGGVLTGAFLGGNPEGPASEMLFGRSQEGFVSGFGFGEGMGRPAGGEVDLASQEREYRETIPDSGVSMRPEERIRIDADVLERAVGDRACSCRICASTRGGEALFQEDDDNPLVDADSSSGDESGELLESALPGGLAFPGVTQVAFSNLGVSEGRPATPLKRRKRRRASLLSRAVCTTAVRALGAAGRLTECLTLLPHLGGSLAGQNLSKALVMHLARDGKVEEALSVLVSSPHRTVPLYNVVMDAASKAWLGHERVVAIFDLIVSDGLEPSVWSYNTVLSALVRENMLPEAFYWLDEMRVRGCKPDAVSYNTLMGARVQFKVARGIFEQMLREGVTPNLRTFNVLIAAVAAIGDYEEAKTWVVRMRGMGIEPSQVRSFDLRFISCSVDSAGSFSPVLDLEV